MKTSCRYENLCVAGRRFCLLQTEFQVDKRDSMKKEMTEGLCRTIFFWHKLFVHNFFPNETLLLKSCSIKSCHIECFCQKYTNNSQSRIDIFMQKQKKCLIKQIHYKIMPTKCFCPKYTKNSLSRKMQKQTKIQ